MLSSKVRTAWEQARVAAADDAVGSIAAFAASGLWEDVPESQCLISGTRYNGASIWVHCEVEDSESMPGESGYLFHGWVFPNYNLVERVAMCAHELIICLREYQVADLGASVYAVQRCQVQGVPETDALIGCTTASGKKASVQWAPVDGFYCCLMIRKPLERPIAVGRPYEELVVVTA